MPDFLMYLLSSLGISYLLSNMDGPFFIISKIRNFLISNKYIGVTAFKILNCAYCFPFWIALIFCTPFVGLLKAILIAFSAAYVSIKLNEDKSSNT